MSVHGYSRMLTGSTYHFCRIWDIRRLRNIPAQTLDVATANANEFAKDVVDEFLSSPKGKGCLRAEWHHNKSVSSAYWDARGRSIVSTSYDDTLRRKSRRQPSYHLLSSYQRLFSAVWDIKGSLMQRDATFPSSRPIKQIRHNCQTVSCLPKR